MRGLCKRTYWFCVDGRQIRVKKKCAFSKISRFVWTGQKYKQNNRHVLYDMYWSFVIIYILHDFPFLKRTGACHSVQFDFLFKSCLPWYWSKVTTVNSLIATTFRKPPPLVKSQSQILYQTLPLNLLYFKSVAILMHDITNNLAPQNILRLFKTTDQVLAYNTGSQSRG